MRKVVEVAVYLHDVREFVAKMPVDCNPEPTLMFKVRVLENEGAHLILFNFLK